MISSRRAFTLWELLLVAALLAALFAFSWPAIEGPLANARLRKAADQLRAQWNAACHQATMSGTIHVFRCEPGTGRFSIQPWTGVSEQASRTGGPQSDGQHAATDIAILNPQPSTLSRQPPDGQIASTDLASGQQQLPEGVWFVSAGDPSGTDAAATAVTATGAAGANSSDFPILFYPDGTATDAIVVLRNTQDSTVTVSLRGLTGSSRVNDE